MRLVMAESKPWPEKLCGMPNIPNRKTSRIPTMSANFQRRFLFMMKTESRYQGMLRLRFCFFFRGRDLRHRSFGHFHHQIIWRNTQMNAVVLQCHDGSAQSSAGCDLVASLQRVQHGRPFLLAPLLGKNQQKVKNREDKNQGGDA